MARTILIKLTGNIRYSPGMWSRSQDAPTSRLDKKITTSWSQEADVSSRLFASRARDVIFPKLCKTRW